jgi:hypothetical protein
MPFTCSGARLKLDRANKHLHDLEEILTNLPNLYTVSVQADGQGRGNRIEHDIPNLERIRDNLALITGDCVHNLRSALDFVWSETLARISPGADAKYFKFPIVNDGQYLESVLKDRKIDVLSPDLFRLMVAEIKPYKAGNTFLWSLHELDIIDKHRLLLPVVQSAGISGITVKNQSEEITGDTWSIDAPPPYRIDIPSTHQVKNEGKLTISILFDDGTPLKGSEVSDTLSVFQRLVSEVVKLLEGTA